LLISPTYATLTGVCDDIASLAAQSPNCAEHMAKWKKPTDTEETADQGAPQNGEVTEVKVRWNAQSHDPKIFPSSTLVTEKNFEAVLRMIGASGVGRDTLEVTIA
jgi:hypothetical protein